MTPEELDKLVSATLAEHGGDELEAMKSLAAEHYATSQDLEAIRADIKATQAKLPPEGARVLSGDDVTDYDAYKAFGSPEDVAKILAEHEQSAKVLAGHQRNDELTAAATAAGVTLSVLKRIAEPGQKFEVRNGRAYVKDGDSEPVGFEVYARKHWKDWLPALRQAPTARPSGAPSRSNGHHANGNGPPAKPTITDTWMNRVRGSF
jgi:hypothetical protein